MKKLIEEAIQYAVHGPEFTTGQHLVYFDSRVKNKVQNKVFNLKKLVDNVFLSLKVGEVVDPQTMKMQALFT